MTVANRKDDPIALVRSSSLSLSLTRSGSGSGSDSTQHKRTSQLLILIYAWQYVDVDRISLSAFIFTIRRNNKITGHFELFDVRIKIDYEIN